MERAANRVKIDFANRRLAREKHHRLDLKNITVYRNIRNLGPGSVARAVPPKLYRWSGQVRFKERDVRNIDLTTIEIKKNGRTESTSRTDRSYRKGELSFKRADNLEAERLQ